MASVSRAKDGTRRVLFVDPDGVRKSIRLGRMEKRAADKIGEHVENLRLAKLSGQPVAPETAAWIATLTTTFREKLERVGLLESTASKKPTLLGEYLNKFISNRVPTSAPNTIRNLTLAARRLTEYFGEDRAIASITHTEAEEWGAKMMLRYAPATAGRTIKRARQFFKAAMKSKLVGDNVFLEIKACGQSNKERQFHVDRETTYRVIDAAPDAEWRLIIALSRFGGLRCPSEHLALNWSDVDWSRDRFRVASSKTGERWVPIFPELRPYLEECFELAEPGSRFVINRYRKPNANLRTQFLRIIRRAGVKPWSRLFHNMRASRQTELVTQFPTHVVCEWIGNSTLVAAQHYLTVRDEDFQKAAQNPAQYLPELDRFGRQSEDEIVYRNQELPSNSANCCSVPVHVYPLQDSNL